MDASVSTSRDIRRRRRRAALVRAWFFLLAGDWGRRSDPQGVSPRTPGNVGRKRRVLIVEDHRQSRDALGGILQYMGFEPVYAVNLSQGVEALAGEPDYLILDLMLPDGCGIDLLRHIRQSGARTKVAVTTGAHDPELMEQVEELRPDVVLLKPLNLTQLVQWLDKG